MYRLGSYFASRWIWCSDERWLTFMHVQFLPIDGKVSRHHFHWVGWKSHSTNLSETFHLADCIPLPCPETTASDEYIGGRRTSLTLHWWWGDFSMLNMELRHVVSKVLAWHAVKGEVRKCSKSPVIYHADESTQEKTKYFFRMGNKPREAAGALIRGLAWNSIARFYQISLLLVAQYVGWEESKTICVWAALSPILKLAY